MGGYCQKRIIFIFQPAVKGGIILLRNRHPQKSHWIMVLVTMVFLGGISCAEQKNTSCRDRAMTVLSFNIRFSTAEDGDNSWVNRRHLLFETLREIDADLIGLQEALHVQIAEIKEALPAYGHFGVGRDDGDTLGEYSAILYKKDRFTVLENGTFWLSDHPQKVASIDWGNACTRICTWGYLKDHKHNRAFYIYNLHLDHVSQYSREQSVALLQQTMLSRSGQDPVIVTGDFNAAEDNPAMQSLKSGIAGENGQTILGLRDSFRELHPKAEQVGTYHAFNGDSTGGKIDYVFIDDHFEVLEAGIIRKHQQNRYPSDHFPVVARVCF